MLNKNIHFIDSKTLSDWLAKGIVSLFDVREEHEFAAQQIPGAISLPLSSFDASQIPTGLQTHIVIHCQSGVRCGVAAQLLQEFGFFAKHLSIRRRYFKLESSRRTGADRKCLNFLYI